MKIAVVGTGISGLAAAWLLSREHEVTVYERNAYVGGHSNTVEADGPEGPVAVDTGFIVYNEVNYPQLTALFRLLGVATRPSDMSFAASVDGGGIEYAGDNLRTLFADARSLVSPGHWRMLRDILRFNVHARRVLESPDVETATLGELLAAGGYSAEFRDRYLIPMGAAIWSCPFDAMLDFPAASFLRFFHNHGLLNLRDRPRWRTVVGGSREYVRKLTAPFAGRILTNRPVRGVSRDDFGVSVHDAQGETRRYDQLVLASHADEALALLDRPTFWERTLLSAFRYERNRALLHTDPALMPHRRRVWASWNYLRGAGTGAKVSVSYWMNRLQGLATARDYFVSLNPLREPARGSVIADLEYDHPVFDRRAIQAQGILGRIQGRRRTWYCGAYFGHGFHEDGLRSGLAVARAFGLKPDWEQAAAPGKVADRPVHVPDGRAEAAGE